MGEPALREAHQRYEQVAEESETFDKKKKRYSDEYSDAFNVEQDGAEILEYLDSMDKERFNRAYEERDSTEIGDLFIKASYRYFDVLGEERVEREMKK